MKYPNLWGMLFNVPLMLQEATAQRFADVFLNIEQNGLAASIAQAASGIKAEHGMYAGNVAVGRYNNKKYTVTDAGIGVLPVYGVMVQRGGQLSPDCTEMTSYQRLGATFQAMMADPDVKGIMLEIDSPGGQVAGNFELANSILGARQSKPVWAHSNEIAFSGGYSLASAAERLYTPMTGMVGSVGVIMQHVNQAAKDQKAGYEYTVIKAGANKDVFNPHAALTAEDRAWAQASVNRARDMFAQIVATGRAIDLKTVLDTEASLIEAPDAKAIGFIDDVATFAETMSAFEQRIKSGSSFVFSTAASQHNHKETFMSAEKPAAQAPAAPAVESKPAAAAAPAAPAAEAAAPVATAPVDQKARISAILGSDEAKGRSEMANHLAFNTDMSADDAKKLMATAPVAEKNPLAAAMGGVPNPKVGADNGNDPAPTKPAINTQEIYARRAQAAADAARR